LDQSGLSLSKEKKNVYIDAQMPGINADDIEVTVDKRVNVIHGERGET